MSCQGNQSVAGGRCDDAGAALGTGPDTGQTLGEPRRCPCCGRCGPAPPRSSPGVSGEVAPARWLLRCRRAKRPGQSLPAASSLQPTPSAWLQGRGSCTRPQLSAWRSRENSPFPGAERRVPDELDGRPRNTQHTAGKGASVISPRHPAGVHSRRALGGGGRALWAPGLLVRERAVISPRRACWEVLLFERGSEPGLQRRDVPCLAPAFPPAPLREVQRRTMKGDATPPKPQAPSPTIIRFSQHAPLLTGHAPRLPAAPGAFLCSTASRPSSQ